MDYLNGKEQRMLVARYLIAEKLKVNPVNVSDAIIKVFGEETGKIHDAMEIIEDSLAEYGFSENQIENVTSHLGCSKGDLDIQTDDAYDWIMEFASKNNLEQCDKKLAKLRKAHERGLKKACKRIGYMAKMISQPKDKEARYKIFNRAGKNYVGCFSDMKDSVKDIEQCRKRGIDIEW